MRYSEKEYQKHIRLLSWQLLIESHANEMPIRITAISKLYGFQNIIDYDESRWDNAKVLCAGILDRFGLNYSGTARKELAVKVLSPLCLLRAFNIQYPEDIVKLCDIPYVEATKRFARLKSKPGPFVTEQERVIIEQFKQFIKSHCEEKSSHL